MALYSNSDITLLKQNIDKINDQVELAQLSQFEPTISEREKIFSLILAHIRKQQLKVYGGYALNKFISVKNPDECEHIYKRYQIPDIDIYSPTPIEDLIAICNLINEAGFKRIHGREGKHKDTYNIYVNFQLYCNLTYVPKHIYNKIPIKEIDTILYVQPFFMTIDYLRILSDPLTSYWRLEKSFKRLVLMHKYYPLLKLYKPIEEVQITPEVQLAINFVQTFLTGKSSCIGLGFTAIKYFMNSIPGEKIINIPYHEFISTSFKSDCEELIKSLRREFPLSNFSHQEYCQFFQFLGNQCTIFLNDEPIAYIYSNNSKAIPYQNVDNIRIGTFSLTLLYAQIMTFKYSVQNERNKIILYQKMVSSLIDVKAKYLTTNRTNIFDNTLFREFVTECVGLTVQPEREMLLRYEEHREKNKKAYFQYDPSSQVKTPETTWTFGNYSGNPITNPKNLILSL